MEIHVGTYFFYFSFNSCILLWSLNSFNVPTTLFLFFYHKLISYYLIALLSNRNLTKINKNYNHTLILQSKLLQSSWHESRTGHYRLDASWSSERTVTPCPSRQAYFGNLPSIFLHFPSFSEISDISQVICRVYRGSDGSCLPISR